MLTPLNCDLLAIADTDVAATLGPNASPSVSAKNTKKLIDYTRSLYTLPSSTLLVTPVVTPRFAISSTDSLLKSLGRLAPSDPTIPVQTHISENRFEIAKTLERFPTAPNYAGVYDMFGLLRHNTILAHACHFSEDEIELVKRRGAGIFHCPISNFNIGGEIAPVGLSLDRGIKVRDIGISSLFTLRKISCQLGQSRNGCFGRLLAVHPHSDPTCLDRL